MVIDDTKKEELIEAFKAIYSNKEDAKALNSSNTEMFKTLAESLQTDKKSLSAAYRYWKEMHENGEDSLEDIVAIVESIKE
jgi:hypothetical protein